MSNFNNTTYEALVKDLINDAFYLETRSRRGTIATIRQYAEVIVRKILNISDEDFVTLGNKKIISSLKEQSQNNSFLLDSINTINIIGNKCTHTQNTDDITEKEIKDVINSLFNLYSYLLISYFEKYEFGLNGQIISSFSILPPIIRYITLTYLNDKYPENIMIIDKLTLAILKAFDKEKAIKWIEERKEILSVTPSVDKRAKYNSRKNTGNVLIDCIIAKAPNMYDLCIGRINRVGNILEKKGRMYDDFEGAIALYYEKGIVQGETSDVFEFNSIMEFLYLGKKARKNELLKERDSYLGIYSF